MQQRDENMRRFFGPIAAILFLCIIAGALVWNVLPGTASRILISLNNTSAGLTSKTVETRLGPIHYLEGGKGETVLLVHGIFARKEHWVDVARALVPDYHVVALDLPGFGDNSTLGDEQYHLPTQSQNFAIVLDALRLGKFHIAANSMGAQISTKYAVDNPDRVKSIAYIGSPLGVPSPIKSDMEVALKNGDFPLVAATPEDFRARNDWLSPQRLKVPSPILRTWMTAEIAQKDKNIAIWHAVHELGSVTNLLGLADKLDVSALVLWCREDRIFHVSGAEELALHIESARVEILEDCGHVPMLDQPEKIARHYRNFLASQSSGASNRE